MLGAVRYELNRTFYPGFEQSPAEPFVAGRLRSTHVEATRQRVLAEMLCRSTIDWVTALLIPANSIASDDNEIFKRALSVLKVVHGDVPTNSKTKVSIHRA